MSRKTERLVRGQGPQGGNWEAENWFKIRVETQFRNWKSAVGFQGNPPVSRGLSASGSNQRLYREDQLVSGP